VLAQLRKLSKIHVRERQDFIRYPLMLMLLYVIPNHYVYSIVKATISMASVLEIDW